jgi:hypothetical protein
MRGGVAGGTGIRDSAFGVKGFLLPFTTGPDLGAGS